MKARCGNIDMHYSVEGEGPWLTLSHSLACDSSMWDDQMSLLTQHFKVLRFDTRGHGQSSAPQGPYTLGGFQQLSGYQQGQLYGNTLAFARAAADGLLPADVATIAGTWGAIHDSGELTYMNLVHLEGIDGTDPDDLTRGEIEGRRQAMHAVDALRAYTPGCEQARLRNFGMTLGVRDTRKVSCEYDMTADDVREQGRFDDSIGIFPEFIDGYGILVLPTTGRYFAKFISAIILGIGFIMVAFTDRKRGLHDMIAGCLVVHKYP